MDAAITSIKVRPVGSPSPMQHLAASDLPARDIVIECLKLFRMTVNFGNVTKERLLRLIDLELSRLETNNESPTEVPSST